MSDQTLQQLLKALSEELSERALKPSARAAAVHERAEDIGPWIRFKDARRHFGIPKARLIDLAIRGKVIAKKFDPEDANSSVVFRTSDIMRAIEEMPDYKFDKYFGRKGKDKRKAKAEGGAA